ATASNGPGQKEAEKPQPFDEKVVKAWQAAGAEVGWLRHELGYLQFVTGPGQEQPGDVPAFQFRAWRDGTLPKLPDLGRGFGLSLYGTQVTDAGLKEIAGLKSLQSLSLSGTQVTDAGLKELTSLKSLQLLNLGNTKVTDAGLKELRKALPNCNAYR